MGVMEMVVALVLISTAGRVAHSWVKRSAGGSKEDRARLRELEEALRTNELRLAQAEERVAELGEKLGFVEALLEAPERKPRLPPPSA